METLSKKFGQSKKTKKAIERRVRSQTFSVFGIQACQRFWRRLAKVSGDVWIAHGRDYTALSATSVCRFSYDNCRGPMKRTFVGNSDTDRNAVKDRLGNAKCDKITGAVLNADEQRS